MSKLQKVLDIYKRYGFSGFFNKLDEKLHAPYRDYNKRIAEYLPSAAERKEQEKKQAEFPFRPLISIVVPTYETEERFLTDLLNSVQNQTYPKWELILADGSKTDRVRNCLERYRRTNPLFGEGESLVRYQRLEKNGGISENTNEGLKLAQGDYIAFMDHDDVLTENALYEAVTALNEKPYRFLYTDEDKVNVTLSFFEQPHFKKDFDLELLRTNNYICHLLILEKKLLDEIGGFRKEFDGSQDYDLTLRAVEQIIFPDGKYHAEKRDEIHHIPKICYHWRMHDASTAGNSSSKSYTASAGLRAVEAHFKRLQIEAELTERIEVGCYRITYSKPPVEMFSDEKIEFRIAEGVVPRTGAKEELLRTLMQEQVGAVCGKVYAKDGTIDQAGLKTLPDGGTEKLFHGLKGSYKGYERRAVLKQESDAAGDTFSVINKELYMKPGTRILFDPDAKADWT